MPGPAVGSSFVVLAAVLVFACGGRSVGTGTPRTDRALITRDQILARKPAPVASRDPHFDWSEHAGIDPMFERAP